MKNVIAIITLSITSTFAMSTHLRNKINQAQAEINAISKHAMQESNNNTEEFKIVHDMQSKINKKLAELSESIAQAQQTHHITNQNLASIKRIEEMIGNLNAKIAYQEANINAQNTKLSQQEKTIVALQKQIAYEKTPTQQQTTVAATPAPMPTASVTSTPEPSSTTVTTVPPTPTEPTKPS